MFLPLGYNAITKMRFRTPILSSFETLIADLFEKDEQSDEAPRPSHPFSIDSLEAAWEAAAKARAFPERADGGIRPTRYTEDGPDSAPEVSLDPNKIQSELGLHSKSTEAEIAILRREFALRNHPDRVPAELREVATQRIMIANDIMDRHIAMLRRPAG
jgi:hypothetical protein